MSALDESVRTGLDRAVQAGHLLESSRQNIGLLLERGGRPLYGQVIEELAGRESWEELNDRFFTELAFGTGGLRGRTIGRIITQPEQGKGGPLDRPEFPCVGTNAMNFFSVSRATQGLVAYLKDWFASRTSELAGPRPRIVIAHDTRHFSRDFAEFTAGVASDNGVDVSLFDGPRSTPELSFAVRHENAQAGIMITASHNPAHDNGYKVYFADGAQIVEPHASGIIGKVKEIKRETYEREAVPGEIKRIGQDVDEIYLAKLETLILRQDVVDSQKESLKVVFTPIHGVGSVITKPLFERIGIPAEYIEEQEQPDGRFPTVQSPNPENAEALTLGIEAAKKSGADLVIATDPDCDRMGCAVRGGDGDLHLLTGNQIGSLLAWYRVSAFFEKGILNEANAKNAVLIKTFVTTDLQKAIAEKHGIRCVETLTGFKYIGQKLGKYEAQLPEAIRTRYDELRESETREARLQYSTYYVFGGEESYGYLGADFVRDKDGNGAALMLAEGAAYAKAHGQTLLDLLDDLFKEYGYYLEKNHSIYMEGAEGAAQIRKLVQSYAEQPPETIGASFRVNEVRNYATTAFTDIEGDPIPKESMLIMELENNFRVAVRPSGTEPKIKYYVFAARLPVPGQKMDNDELARAKEEIPNAMAQLWQHLQEDANQRLS